MTVTTKRYKGIGSLTDEEKWLILSSYIKGNESNKDISERFSITVKTFEDFIRTTYTSFQNARESKLLIATVNRPDLYQTLQTKYLDSEQINQPFLDKLSSDNDLLSDSELLFCEFLMEYGDDAKAIEKSKLNVGLKKTKEALTSYNDSLRIRSFYLKRKPNVSLYLNEQNKRNLTVLKDGKEFIQTNLIALIEQLKNNNDLRHLPSQLKAIESLGRTIGAFDDKITVHSGNGDDALDRILNAAKKVKETKPMLSYSSDNGDLEVYDP